MRATIAVSVCLRANEMRETSARAPRARLPALGGSRRLNGFSGPPAADQTGGNAGVHCVASSGMGQFTSPHRHLPHHQGSPGKVCEGVLQYSVTGPEMADGDSAGPAGYD